MVTSAFQPTTHKCGKTKSFRRHHTQLQNPNNCHLDIVRTKKKAVDVQHKKNYSKSRRTFMTTLTISLGAMMTTSRRSEAACLSGDVNPECIGVYKLPLDDAVNSYIDTPEHLAKYAPDMRWVPLTEYPKSYKAAKDELVEIQSKFPEIIALVQKGDLTNAGTRILAITPRVTVASRVILRKLQKESDMEMKAMRVENSYLELLSSLGAADIVIGQALAGRLGSITMSQIQVLDDLRAADEEFKDLLRALPENYDK